MPRLLRQLPDFCEHDVQRAAPNLLLVKKAAISQVVSRKGLYLSGRALLLVV